MPRTMTAPFGFGVGGTAPTLHPATYPNYNNVIVTSGVTGGTFTYTVVGTTSSTIILYPTSYPIMQAPYYANLGLSADEAIALEDCIALTESRAAVREPDRAQEVRARIAAHDPHAAAARARELLIEHLTAEQRETYQRHGFFVVEGGRSKQKYRIRSGSLIGNVDVLDGDNVRHRLCAHAAHEIPMGDQLLIQKFLLEHDEDHFLRTANRHAPVRM